ncbi:MAG TPA: S1 RNA-binding domain-containing protein, partial [Candidatus Acetothermia bacterium]|nr:S1 RNA-binding domain-containing protein [Candidatus Acetothermia bacterium]
IEETGAEIDIADDGTVKIAGATAEAVAAAQEWIRDLTTELEVGTVMKVRVTRIVDFGAFVALKNGSEGLVHVSNLADGYVDNVRDFVSPGDEITIEVIGVDKMGRPDLKRIDGGSSSEARPRARANRHERQSKSSEKPAAPKPHVQAGDIIDGVVTNITDYGAFVEIAPEVTGLVHISALSDEYVRRVTDVVKPGDPIRVEVLNIDDRGRYKLRRIIPESERTSEQTPDADDAEPETDGEDGASEAAMADAKPSAPKRAEEAREEDEQPDFEDRW